MPSPKKVATMVTKKPPAEEPMEGKFKLGNLNLKRNKPQERPSPRTEEPPKVSAGSIDKVIDLAFNASRDKMREVTIIDRLQGRLLPLLDVINISWQYVIMIAEFRADPALYAQLHPDSPVPVPPELIDEYIYRIAQWQKSVAGRNLEKAIDLALAEMETKGDDEEYNAGSGFGTGD